MTDNIVTYGYPNAVGQTERIVTYGFSAGGAKFREVIAQMEKTDPSFSYIDYQYIEPGNCMEPGSIFQQMLEGF